MPKFELHKLVRDGLRKEYEIAGQKATYIELSPDEHKRHLARKVIEEVIEIPLDEKADNLGGGFADVQQAIDDLMVLYGVAKEQVETAQKAKYAKKGGFAGGTFVTTLELADKDEEWIEYYRKRPDVFPEK